MTPKDKKHKEEEVENKGASHEHDHDHEECECKKKHESEIEKLSKEVSYWQSQYTKALNTAAHHENLSKYYKNEFDKLYRYRSQDLIEQLLPALDSFQMAFSTKSSSSEVEAYKMGFEFILRLFKNALEAEGVKEITPKEQDEYDPHLHHAVETVEVDNDKDAHKVTKILLNGYILHDRILRPANIKVSVLKKENTVNNDSNEEVTTQVNLESEPQVNENVTNEDKINEEEVTNG